MLVNSKVFSLGNSNAIRIPKLLMESIGLKADDPVSIEVVGNDELRIKKNAETSAYPSIKELFAGYTGSYHPEEWDTGDAVGKEML